MWAIIINAHVLFDYVQLFPQRVLLQKKKRKLNSVDSPVRSLHFVWFLLKKSMNAPKQIFCELWIRAFKLYFCLLRTSSFLDLKEPSGTWQSVLSLIGNACHPPRTAWSYRIGFFRVLKTDISRFAAERRRWYSFCVYCSPCLTLL